MGLEPVYHRQKWFYFDNQTISWIQKFMELYLSEFTHPVWFIDILNNLRGDFYIPYRKEFFDQDIINNDKEKLQYCIEMVDVTIKKIQTIDKRKFFCSIKKALNGSWCDISGEFYNEDWLENNDGFEETIIDALVKLKELMTDDLNSPLI